MEVEDRICIVCQKTEIKPINWLCLECYKFLTIEVIQEVIEEVGGSYDFMPKHIPKEQYDKYFVDRLLKVREEMGNKNDKEKETKIQR